MCGFEAYINDKKIIATVKEKSVRFFPENSEKFQEAKREYQQAVLEGKGAYLLDEEEPDVFVCSIGNIPAKTRIGFWI